jgi:probable HAF family extracellular repeat protein
MAEDDEERIMKAKKLSCMAAIVILAAVTNPAALSAQEQASAQKHESKHSHYKVIDLGTFGGPHSTVNSDSVNTNVKGTVIGGASTSTPDPACTFDSHCFVFHAFKYRKNVLTDLGKLPGGTNSFAIAINTSGAIAGISENGAIDPVTGVADFVATVWKNGQILDLGTFGGSFSLPNAINDRGQAAGGAENTIPDPFNFGGLLGLPSPTQWHATLWQHGSMHDLGTLGDGLDSFAQFVNQHGQAAGVSFTNSIVNPETGIPTVDPFFWENGQMVDVGTLGGVFAVLSGLNNNGQVTGTSDVTRDGTVQHAFLWERGQLQDLGTFGGDFSSAHWIDDSGEVVGDATTKNNGLLRAARWKSGHMTNLGALNGDPCSFAVGSNSKGQIIGNSVSGECEHDLHPFLWENGGPMVDLNTLIPPGSGLVLHEATYINELGEITGAAFLPNGEEHAFLLIPKAQDDDDASSSTAPTQADVAPGTPSLTNLAHSRLAPEKVAAFAARLAHRSRSMRAIPTK